MENRATEAGSGKGKKSGMSNQKFMLLQAAFTPSEVLSSEHPVCVYVDAIRASATMVTFFEKGISQIRLCGDEEAVLAKDTSIDRRKYVVCVEDVPGDRAPMADCSPAVIGVQAMEHLEGKKVLFHSTNGTLGIQRLFEKDLKDIYVGTVLNRSAVMHVALEHALAENRPLCIVDSGRWNCTIATLDDAYCTAKLAQTAIGVLKQRNIPYELMDPVKIVLHLLPQFKDNYDAYIQSSTAIKCAAHIPPADVAACSADDISNCVPRVYGVDEFGCILIDCIRVPGMPPAK